jgi:large subunit GTPase 1
MPRSQGTSRKGKPKKHERAAGMGRALQKSRVKRHTPSASLGGMAQRDGVQNINMEQGDHIKQALDNRASVLDVNDLDDFLIQAEMADREFISEKEQVVLLDATAQAAGDVNENGGIVLQGNERTNSKFAFAELSVPRRPAWDENTTAAELDQNEKDAFLEWRRAIAEREEEISLRSSSISSLGVTPFEKNLEIWRQLWRVLERCSCIVQVVDARNPLFYLSQDLKAYTTKELGKPMLLLINKSDYLTPIQRQAWHEYLSHPDHQWTHVFFSAHEQQKQVDEDAARMAKEEAEEEERRRRQDISVLSIDDSDDEEDDDDHDVNEATDNDKDTEEEKVEDEVVDKVNELSLSDNLTDNIGVQNPLTRAELLNWLETFAHENGCSKDHKYNRVPFGMVGFPNVGKSSVINVLMGNAKNAHGVVRVGVAAQPGKTKHFQTLLLPDREDMLLCDCPGLVFPSFVSNTADLIAAGVYPIAQMRDWKTVMDLLCQRIPREVLNAQYSIKIPMPTADAMYEAKVLQGTDEIRIPPPTADEFLTTFCVARSILAASSGVPDYQRAARMIIMEYATGKLLYCHSPPNFEEDKFQKETLLLSLQKTKKLREKLAEADARIKATEIDDGVDESKAEDLDIEDDDMLLELLGGTSTSGHNEKTKPGESKRQKKWGKKGRKGRNKDPYGCHSTPDEMLGGSDEKNMGVSVKGGKKHQRKNYTRSTGYGATRAFQ